MRILRAAGVRMSAWRSSFGLLLPREATVEIDQRSVAGAAARIPSLRRQSAVLGDQVWSIVVVVGDMPIVSIEPRCTFPAP
jgi:hypothetical protein